MGTSSWSPDFGPENLRFSIDAARGLITKLDATITAVEAERSAFVSDAHAAMEDFTGVFAHIFRDHVGWADVDGKNLIACLTAVRQYASRLVSSAEAENRRRSTTRESRRQKYAELEHAHRTSSQLPGPIVPAPAPSVSQVRLLVPFAPGAAPSFSAGEVSLKARERYTAGSTRAGGSSSARPDRLRRFAHGGSGLARPGSGLQAAWHDFVAGQHGWGSVDASGVIRSVQQWHEANAEEREWIGQAAGEFENAGGRGGIHELPDDALGQALASAGTFPGRQAIRLELPQTLGSMPGTGYAADPVNTATGNFIEPEVDLPHEGIAETLALHRMYNAQNEGSGVFGPGWSSVFDTRLTLSDERAEFVMPDGRRLVFPREGEGWGRAVHENYWLACESVGDTVEFSHVAAVALPSRGADRALVVRGNGGEWWMCDLAGRWLGSGRGAGTSVAAVRSPRSGLVSELRHEHGRAIAVQYAHGRVSRAEGAGGRCVDYCYDGAGRLIGVEGGSGVRSYRWNEDGLIDRVVAASGVVECVNTYDAKRRVATQITEFGREVKFSYLSGRVTVVSDADGSNANSWVANPRGQLVRVVDTDGNVQAMSYDGHGNLLTVQERDGSSTIRLYDERGRVTRSITPEGVEQCIAYDDRDRAVRITERDAPGGARTAHGATGEAVTAYEYRGDDRFPSTIVDALGAKTTLVWQRGLLKKQTDPTGRETSFEYDEHGDLTGVTDGAGNTTRYARDAAGRVLETVSPSGYRTRLVYEGDHPVRLETADGAEWRYEYSPSGLLTAVVDPEQGRTEYEYGTHGQIERVVDPLGRVSARAFDAMGNPRSITTADGAEWGLRYDGLSRLRAVIDPAGHPWRYEYGPNGDLTETADPTGVTQTVSHDRERGRTSVRSAFSTTTVHFDRYERLLAAEIDGQFVERVVYDACGRGVEYTDATGGVTRVKRDPAGRPVEVISPEGRATRYAYDPAGRPSALVDPLGATTAFVYDADSRVVARVLPSGDRATIEYDPVGRVLREEVPGRGIRRYRYDRAGRLTWTQGPQHGTRRFVYDAAGQLVRAINGLGGSTEYAYDDLGRVVSITDPLGATTTRRYSALNRVTRVTDPNGRVTTASYDAAGRQQHQTGPDGRQLTLSFDTGGRLVGLAEDGSSVADITYESVRASAVRDHTHPSGEPLTHRIVRDAAGRMCERQRGGRTTLWSYDGDGLRTHTRAPNGSRASYAHDPAGRVSRIEHSAFGVVTYEYDPDGRITQTRAGELVQAWKYERGLPVEYTRVDADGAHHTRIEHDELGRISRLLGPDGVTSYSYDECGQLTRAETVDADGETVADFRWCYDSAGRLVREASLERLTSYTYDSAGQLLSSVAEAVAAGSPRAAAVTAYAYDRAGRRISEIGPNGETRYEWNARGGLTGITTRDSEGEVSSRQLWVDATGELAEIDGLAVSWDTAAPFPTPVCIDQTPVFGFPGGVTGAGHGLFASGWRQTRSIDTNDPWSTAPLAPSGDPALEGLASAGIGVSAHAGLLFDGIEPLGARAYQPSTHGFLSVDPLQPVPGAAWGSNPYSYAGNNPVGQLDPLGLSPLTDEGMRGFGVGLFGLVPPLPDDDKRVWEKVADALLPVKILKELLGDRAWAKHWDAPEWYRKLPQWAKTAVKFTKFVPFVGIPVTLVLAVDALLREDWSGLTQYGVSFVLDLVGLAFLPVALAGLLWDIGWVVIPTIGGWWRDSVVPWWNDATADFAHWYDACSRDPLACLGIPNPRLMW